MEKKQVLQMKIKNLSKQVIKNVTTSSSLLINAFIVVIIIIIKCIAVIA